MTAIIAWSGVLAITAAAVFAIGVGLYITRDKGTRSAPRSMPRRTAIALRLWGWAGVAYVRAWDAWDRLTERPGDSQDPPPPPTPEPDPWEPPQLDYQLGDNTTWNELRAIGKGGQP